MTTQKMYIIRLNITIYYKSRSFCELGLQHKKRIYKGIKLKKHNKKFFDKNFNPHMIIKPSQRKTNQ